VSAAAPVVWQQWRARPLALAECKGLQPVGNSLAKPVVRTKQLWMWLLAFLRKDYRSKKFGLMYDCGTLHEGVKHFDYLDMSIKQV